MEICNKNFEVKEKKNLTNNKYLRLVLPFNEINKYPQLLKDLKSINDVHISIEISSLEEAFINFMYIEENNLEENENYDIDQNIPQSFFNPTHINHLSQIQSV